MAAAAGPNPATPVGQTSTVARASTSASAAAQPQRSTQAQNTAARPVSSSAAAAAASPSASPASSVSAAAASSSASRAASPSASSAAASSSSASPSASRSDRASALVSSASTRSNASASPQASASLGGLADSAASSSGTTTNKLSTGAIGGIAGGAAGGLILAFLLFWCWRRRRHQGEKVPPPPPRDMSYSNTARARTVSGVVPGSFAGRDSMMQRDSSYNTLLTGPNAGMTSRPSYYSSYPIGTPSTTAGPTVGDSPPLVPSDESAATTGPPTNGTNTPMYPQHLGHSAAYNGTGGALPMPLPMHSPVRSSYDEGGRPGQQAKRIPSIDRLRAQSRGDGSLAGPSQSQPQTRVADMTGVGTGPLVAGPQPYAAAATGVGAPGISEFGQQPSGSSTPPSPTRSATMTPRSTHSGSFSQHRFPRPDSMHSLASRTGSNYIHIGPAGGAPHQGRPIRLAMPALLSDSSRDLYAQQQPASPYPAFYGQGQGPQYGSQSLNRRPNSIGGDMDALRFASQSGGRYPAPAPYTEGVNEFGAGAGADGRDRMVSMPSHTRQPSSPIRMNPNRHSMGPVSPPRQQSYQAPISATPAPRSPTKLKRTGSGGSDNWVQTNHHYPAAAGGGADLPGLEERRGSEAV